MNLKLIEKFGKKNIPDVRVGDTVRVYFKVTEGNKTRIQIFEGICIALKHGKGLDGSIKLRKISGGVGVERTFPMHSPLITKFEKVKSVNVRQSKLYFLRDLKGKKARRKGGEFKDFQIWEEALSEEELAKIEEDKKETAEKKATEKAKKEEELKEKFDQAVAAHKQTDAEEKTEEKKEEK